MQNILTFAKNTNISISLRKSWKCPEPISLRADSVLIHKYKQVPSWHKVELLGWSIQP